MTVSNENINIEDNKIILNKNETDNGISHVDRCSGIELKRGSLSNAKLLFDESDDKFKIDKDK